MRNSITTKELIELMSKMKDGADTVDLLKPFDENFSQSRYQGLITMFRNKYRSNGNNDVPCTEYSSFAEVLTAQGTDSIADAIIALQVSSLHRGLAKSPMGALAELLGSLSRGEQSKSEEK